jgi:hypothetical protein
VHVLLQQDNRQNKMGLTCKPVGNLRSITRKLENKLAEEVKLQKEKKEKKVDKR